jgi:L-rhamnose isomerase
LPEDPLAAFRASGYQQRIDRERAEKNLASAGGGYA